ncbi:restriction endonuclease subunit S [Gluconacetobacter entanii]|uniref:Restriction endonuclease subunit S n=1 Tax=Gluconacetobacter entanii TaxID=108528 RepID=A0A318PTC7_9PROT|nr:restriction endonuclease subunit S [Gluconacetobacter entanii]PYD60942.1 restriction endonuclease subunit S [Gluconacetobacter entanii]
MSFPKYPAYKDSGVEWIREIPLKWDVTPIRSLSASAPKSFMDGDWIESPFITNEGIRLIQTGNIGIGRYKEQGFRYISEETFQDLNCTEVKPNDLLICRLADPVGRACLAPTLTDKMITSVDVAILKPANYASAEYFKYVLSSPTYLSFMEGECRGGTRNRVSRSFLGSVRVPLPPLSEQQAIASFLDRECGKIDALITEQERLVALLAEKRQAVISHAVTKGLNPNAPMKDSGIPWIGMVPEGWNIVKIGKIFSEINEPGNDSLPILSVSIHSGVSDDELSEEKLDRKVTRSDDRSKYIVVRPGDLTYNMMRAWQGGFGAVQVLGMVSPAYVVARPKNIFWQKTVFIELLLRTPNAIVEMKRHSRGVTDFRLRLYWDEFKNISIPLPKWEEQNSILNFIKKKTGQFDALSMVANKAIVLLKERRSALISAAVTGKIDVRNQSKANAA